MSTRIKPRIDYKLLHSIWRILINGEDLSDSFDKMSLNDSHQDDLKVRILCQLEEIKDVVDENPINESCNLEKVITKLEQLRTEFRKRAIIFNSTNPDNKLQEQVN